MSYNRLNSGMYLSESGSRSMVGILLDRIVIERSVVNCVMVRIRHCDGVMVYKYSLNFGPSPTLDHTEFYSIVQLSCSVGPVEVQGYRIFAI